MYVVCYSNWTDSTYRYVHVLENQAIPHTQPERAAVRTSFSDHGHLRLSLFTLEVPRFENFLLGPSSLRWQDTEVWLKVLNIEMPIK